MSAGSDIELDTALKEKRGGFIAMVKWPLINTAAILAFIWIVFSVLPPDWGWRFGTRFKLFFSFIAIAGGLFFVLLKIGSMQEIRSPWKTMAGILAVFLVTIGALVTLGFVLPQYEIPKGGEKVEAASAQERGKALFQDPSVGCYLCHALGGPGATRGPDLSKIGETGATSKPGMSLEEYLRESLIDPTAYIVPDYPPIMPTNLGDRLTEEQIEDLIAFLKSLR